MTQQQSKLLAFIVSHQQEMGFTPSYSEMATHMGLVSKGSINRMINALRRSGHIEASKNMTRAIKVIRDSDVPDILTHCPHCGRGLRSS